MDPSMAMSNNFSYYQNNTDGSHVSDYGTFEDGTDRTDHTNGASQEDSTSVGESISRSSVSTSYQHDTDNEAGLRQGDYAGENSGAFVDDRDDATANGIQASGRFSYDPSGLSNHFQQTMSLNSMSQQASMPTANVQTPAYNYTNANYTTSAYPNGNVIPPVAATGNPQQPYPSSYPATQAGAYLPQSGGNYSSHYPVQPATNSIPQAQPQPMPSQSMAHNAPMPNYSNNSSSTNYQNSSRAVGQQQVLGTNQYASTTGREREQSDYDMQSESMPLPAPDGVEHLAAQPLFEPHSNKQRVNCAPEIMRCTLRAIPSSRDLLTKSRLPFGVVLQPFRDMHQLPVLQVGSIVRCKNCRTYVNPFVTFLDSRRWRCNVCLRPNDLPEDFLYDPTTRTYGDAFARAEVRSSTVEYIAPVEYAVRPPQPSMYVFLIDVTQPALATGYLKTFSSLLHDHLERLPGDARKQVAFISYDSAVHFYAFREEDEVKAASDTSSASLSPDAEARRLFRMHVCADLDDLTLPLPSDALLVNVAGRRDTIRAFLSTLPSFWELASSKQPPAGGHQNALGPALTVAHRLIAASGGRITIINCTQPNVGVGALHPREAEFRKSPAFTADTPSNLLSPSIDTYKRLGVECSTSQVGVDLFALGAVEHLDLASIAPVARFSAGTVFYYPLVGKSQVVVAAQLRKFEGDLRRYLVRRLGAEAVLRLRCTKGISVQNYYGNFFVRATDLCNLANVSPDLGCAAHLRIDESLSEYVNATIQCAVLYSHSSGERRIRVHTMSIPITERISEVLQLADQQAVICLLARMAAERAATRSLNDARDGIVTSLVDVLEALRSQRASQYGGARSLTAPHALRLIGVYSLALLKSVALKPTCNSIDERVFALEQIRQMPAHYLILKLYPALYCLDVCEDSGFLSRDVDLSNLNQSLSGSSSLSKSLDAPTYPPLVRLSSRNISSSSIYLIDNADALYVYVGDRVRSSMLLQLFGTESISVQQCAEMTELPALNNLASNYVRRFIQYLKSRRAFGVAFAVIKEEANRRAFLSQFLVEDRNEVVASQANLSYVDFLAQVRDQLK